MIFRCLEVAPTDRYETAAHVAFQLQHPEQVPLTARARRTARDGIVTVALDLAQGSEALAEALRLTTRRILQTEPGARLACLTVLKTPRLAIDANVDSEGSSLRMRLLVELRHWGLPLGLGVGRITHHVLEAPDPAAAILDFAGSNHVDHIVIGSRGSSTLRRYLGSVSSQVVAQSNCTVTVVKTTDPGTAPDATSPR